MCALALPEYKEIDIMKMGQWAPNSTTCMEYIQPQPFNFSAGMFDAMRKSARVMNMEGAGMKGDYTGQQSHKTHE